MYCASSCGSKWISLSCNMVAFSHSWVKFPRRGCTTWTFPLLVISDFICGMSLFILFTVVFRSRWSFSISCAKAFAVSLGSLLPPSISAFSTAACIWLIFHNCFTFHTCPTTAHPQTTTEFHVCPLRTTAVAQHFTRECGDSSSDVTEIKHASNNRSINQSIQAISTCSPPSYCPQWTICSNMQAHSFIRIQLAHRSFEKGYLALRASPEADLTACSFPSVIPNNPLSFPS